MESVYVIAGSVNLNPISSSGQIRNVSQIINHYEYNPYNINNNIALLRLESPLEFNYYVKAVHLPQKSETDLEFKLAVASGWGKAADVPQKNLEKLNFVDLYIENQKACKLKYADEVVFDGVVCAFTDGGTKSTCTGDFGGPLVLKSSGNIIGVTSFVSGECCENGSPAGFTRVTYYLDWIKSNSGVGN